MCMFIVSHATVCFCTFLVGYPQTSEPVIALVDWHKLTYHVLTCRKTPITPKLRTLQNKYMCMHSTSRTLRKYQHSELLKNVTNKTNRTSVFLTEQEQKLSFQVQNMKAWFVNHSEILVAPYDSCHQECQHFFK